MQRDVKSITILDIGLQTKAEHSFAIARRLRGPAEASVLIQLTTTDENWHTRRIRCSRPKGLRT